MIQDGRVVQDYVFLSILGGKKHQVPCSEQINKLVTGDIVVVEEVEYAVAGGGGGRDGDKHYKTVGLQPLDMFHDTQRAQARRADVQKENNKYSHMMGREPKNVMKVMQFTGRTYTLDELLPEENSN